jgi:alpha-mannosidase
MLDALPNNVKIPVNGYRLLCTARKVITMKNYKTALAVVILLISVMPRWAQGDPNAAKPDLSKDKVLYVVGYAHLDTEWRWDYTTTIDDFIKSTLDDNFTLFEKYPAYTFNFTGSTRYAMMKEYYPDKYQKLKDYIAKGRWFVSGSSVDEGDVLIPSAESVIRQILYGNDYFRKEFSKESDDYMLPDCFGFPASLPTVLSHCGVKGFSTQKLTWRSAVGIPFNIGVWEGPDGQSVIAALNPTVYLSRIPDRLDINDMWVKRVEENGAKYGVFVDYRYYGVGDMGGAPREQDVANAVKSLNNPDGKIKVVLASSDQMYNDITEEQKAKLPRYKGDFLLTLHSAGAITSQAYMKRWNCKNELLADSAERAAVAAQWLGGAIYPQEKLNWSWIRLLSSQFHDILPGTSIPKAYEYAWNDEIVASNGFAAVLTDSAGAVSRGLDTRVKGKAVVVYNPLAIEREDVVEAQVGFVEKVSAVQVFGPDGKEVPSQFAAAGNNSVKVLFLAKMPAVGFAVYDIRPSKAACEMKTGLAVSKKTIENEFYKVSIGNSGNVTSIIDKKNNKELLAGAVRLEFMKERPQRSPAWDMDWADQSKPPYAYVDGPAAIRVVEKGPARVAVEIKRQAQNSIFVQKIMLSAGEAGSRIEFADAIDWQSTECALKVAFPLSVANSKATYNWGVGTVERGNNDPNKYEVPSHEWFDLTDRGGKYGVTVLQHCKFGSDKPNDNTLRLTLLYTPGVRDVYLDQSTQDWGCHDIVYGLYGHEGDWRQGQSEWQARRLNQPLVAFEVSPHDGKLGKAFSLLSVSTPAVDVRALKKAEHCDYIIVRLQELFGQEAKNVSVSLAGTITDAYEVDGQERRIGNARVENGKLVCDMTKYSPRSFAVKMEKANVRLAPPASEIIALDYNVDVMSLDSNYRNGAIEETYTMPADMLPGEIVSEGIAFKIGSGADDRENAVVCNGQTIVLPKGRYNRLYVLAAATRDTGGVFRFGDKEVRLTVQPWTGFVGQYDNRIWDRQFTKMEFKCDAQVIGIKTGYIKRDSIAWFCTHRHQQTNGNESYQFSYIFKYAMDVPEGAANVTLPDNNSIKIFAMTLSNNENDATKTATPLYDDFTGRKPVSLRLAQKK